MSVTLDEHGFGRTWHSFTTDSYCGFHPRMTDYHMHDYYEISIILEGNVKVLLPGLAESGTDAKIVLMRPRTPHFIVNNTETRYRRRNILFADDFIANYVPEWTRLAAIFQKNGALHKINAEECKQYCELVDRMEEENDPFRIRLYLLMMLSLIADRMKVSGEIHEPPAYVTGALAYISEHYREKIVASDLAWQLGVGRTTLMTAFRKYTGSTLSSYILQCRLKHATEMMRKSATEQQAAEACGFSDAGNLIRAFRRRFSMTPRQYLRSNENR